jgi:hypothetical protein
MRFTRAMARFTRCDRQAVSTQLPLIMSSPAAQYADAVWGSVRTNTIAQHFATAWLGAAGGCGGAVVFRGSRGKVTGRQQVLDFADIRVRSHVPYGAVLIRASLLVSSHASLSILCKSRHIRMADSLHATHQQSRRLRTTKLDYISASPLFSCYQAVETRYHHQVSNINFEDCVD